MKSRNFLTLAMALGCFTLADTTAHAQTKHFKGCVDALIDWKNPWNLTPEEFRQVGEALPKTDSKLQVLTSNDKFMTLSAAMGGKLTLFNGKLEIIMIQGIFQDGKVAKLTFEIGDHRQPATPSMVTRLKAELTKCTGDSAPKPGTGTTKYSLEWKGPNSTVLMDEYVNYKKDRTGVYRVNITRQ